MSSQCETVGVKDAALWSSLSSSRCLFTLFTSVWMRLMCCCSGSHNANNLKPITSGPGCNTAPKIHTTFQLLDASDYHSSFSIFKHWRSLSSYPALIWFKNHLLEISAVCLEACSGDLCFTTAIVRALWAPHLSLKWLRNYAAKDIANMLRIWEE